MRLNLFPRFTTALLASSLLLLVQFGAPARSSVGVQMVTGESLLSQDLFYPRTYAGEGEMAFRVYPEFTPRDYLYYIMVGPEAYTTIHFPHGFPYQHDYGAGLDGVTNLHVTDPGNYTVKYSGAGMMAIVVIPDDWRVWQSPGLLAEYSGPFPPGWFAFVLVSPDSTDNSHVKVLTTFDVPVATAVFALDSGMQFRGWLDDATAGSLVVPLTRFELSVSIHIYNPTDDVIEGSVQVLPFTPPFSPDPRAVISVVVVAGTLTMVAVVLFRDWRMRRAQRQLTGRNPPEG